MTALYDYFMLTARSFEQQGEFAHAAKRFMVAAQQKANTPLETAVAYRGAGINFRLAGMLTESLRSFNDAFASVSQAYSDSAAAASTEYNNILSDWGMAYLAAGDAQQALEMFQGAIDGHTLRGEAAAAARTIGFRGRAFAVLGDRDKAIFNYHVADRSLSDDPEHEVWWLNNAIWYMKILGPSQRFVIGPKAIASALRTGYKRRAVEALTLMIGGMKLYNHLRQSHGH